MGSDVALLTRVSGRICAVPIRFVTEIMRPLPVEPMAGMHTCVLGLSIIRGRPTPVVELARILGAETHAPIGGFISLRVENLTVALAVEAISGINTLDTLVLQDLPPLLKGEQSEMIEAIGNLDAQLLVILRAARIVPEEVWTALAALEVST